MTVGCAVAASCLFCVAVQNVIKLKARDIYYFVETVGTAYVSLRERGLTDFERADGSGSGHWRGACEFAVIAER